VRSALFGRWSLGDEIVYVVGPHLRIVLDVVPDGIKSPAIAYDVLIEIALPDDRGVCAAENVYAFGGHSLECADQATERFAFGDGCSRGGSRTKPTIICASVVVFVGDDNDAVQVIGHDNPGVQTNIRVLIGQPIPRVGDDLPEFIQTHFAVDDFTEQRSAILSARGDEIGASLTIVVSL